MSFKGYKVENKERLKTLVNVQALSNWTKINIKLFLWHFFNLWTKINITQIKYNVIDKDKWSIRNNFSLDKT